MRASVLSVVLVMFIFGTLKSQTKTTSFKVGDIFMIGVVSGDNYKAINFPRANFIIKRGSIVNYDNIRGQKVVITKIVQKSNGEQEATLQLVNSKKFFNSHTTVTATMARAVALKELLESS